MQEAETWMKRALALANQAAAEDEVPVGCIIVKGDEILAEAYNRRESDHRLIAHAELLAIDQANQMQKSWRLSDCDLYVTLEPCIMCAGAIFQARIARVFFAASDPKAGALGSVYQLHRDSLINHHTSVIGGLCAEDAKKMLSEFFQKKRT